MRWGRAGRVAEEKPEKETNVGSERWRVHRCGQRRQAKTEVC